MASRWTDKYAILRDLAFAQGSTPLDIDNPISPNEKPPREIYQEETPVDFYTDCVANGDFSKGPDIKMIQELLNTVREVNICTDLETDNAIEMSKLNINRQESPGPSGKQTLSLNSRREQNENTKKRKNRNAAMISLIETYGENNETSIHDSIGDSAINLLKPNDFIQSNEQSSTQDKVSTWFNCSEKMLLSPGNMFRKKAGPSNGASMFKKKEKPIEKITKCENKSEVYVPSLMASEYYEKYVEQSKMKETLIEDIWTRAENKMKEIDEKREKEKASVKSATRSEPVPAEADGANSPSTGEGA